MIQDCNFKSRTRHHASPGCYLTPNEVVCPGEENCVLFQTYAALVKHEGIIRENAVL